MMKPLSVALLSSVSVLTYAQQESEIYDCAFCMFTGERVLEKGESFYEACSSIFPGSDDICSKYTTDWKLEKTMKENPRSFCEKMGECHANKKQGWRGTKLRNEGNNLDIRVSKAYGSKGYEKVRVSVISNETIASDIFSYSEEFKYRWTSNVLNTGIVSVVPGATTSFTIQGQTFNIKIPADASPVRGVVIADPCFSNDYVWCSYGDDFDTFNRSTSILNAIHAHDDSDFWMVLGDNFYDQTGEITEEWFAALSPETKSRVSFIQLPITSHTLMTTMMVDGQVYGSVPGNHDFWILSAPKVWMPKKDQV